jgi:hypothetical protein
MPFFLPTRYQPLAFAFLISITGNSQEILNQSTYETQPQDKSYKVLAIRFDLTSKDANVPYVARLKFIDNDKNKIFYLKKIRGDCNKLIYPGINKVIEWDKNDELIYYRGLPYLELEVAPALQVDLKVKRGRIANVIADPLLITEGVYSLALYRKGKYFGLMEDTVSLKTINAVSFPKNTPTKKFQLAYLKDGKPVVFSNTFKVKPRISNFWKVIPVIVGAGILGYLWYDKQTEPLPHPPPPTK